MADKLNITRRDFLHGVALSLAAGTSLAPFELLAQSSTSKPYYPPLLTGLRGSHVGSFEVAHAVAMAGARYGAPAEQTDATYDLVVVGGGISGLSAAYLYQQRHGGDKNVLVLDNHDDFGGHAKRNEFNVDGKTLIGYGGSQSLESPGQYSPEAKQLIRSIGIETERFYDYFDRSFVKDRGMQPGIYFSREAYGQDKTLPNALGDFAGGLEWEAAVKAIADYPVSESSKASLIDLLSSDKNYLADIATDDRAELLRGMSYDDFLRRYTSATEEVVTIIRDSFKGYWGFGMDILSALEGFRLEMPGTWYLGLEKPKEGLPSREEPYIFHFPDGNAGVARALVRQLLPDAVPGATMEDLVTARIDYSRLDRRSNSTRIRLNATAVDVRHTADQSHVDVTYIGAGKPQRVRGRHVILACYNRVIPHIAPELPAAQREAISYAEKTPLVYINVAVRNWQAMAELGFHSIYIPDSPMMHSFGLDFPVSIGDYAFTAAPDQPTVLHGTFCPTAPNKGLNQKQQNLLGQRRIMEMSFGEIEQQIMRQVDGALAPGGFDAERDVAALTVNRWPHGYAYEYNDLFDPPDLGPDKGPHIAGRAQIGRISIANSDASAYSYVNGAIDAAVRAVKEQTTL
jgi:spermidine dehydrogenase